MVAQGWPRGKGFPRMWSPRGGPGVDNSLEFGSHMQAQHCHTTSRHRRMALHEQTADNPKLGHGLGPWTGGFALMGGSEAINIISQAYLEQRFFLLRKTHVDLSCTKNRKFCELMRVRKLSWFCVGEPTGNPWPVLMPGVCGFSVGLGSCTSLRHSWQA